MKPILKKALKVILYFHGVLLLCLILTHCSLKHYAEKSYEQAKIDKPYDVIIVPGAPYVEGEESSVVKMRMLWAKHLYDSGYTKNIIFSGSSVYSPYVEGIVMKIMADSLHIPATNTFSETKAEHSTENVYYSWKMAKSLGFNKIALATDPYQSGMLNSFVNKYCPDVKSIPVVFEKVDLKNNALPVIDCRPAYVKNFVSITERESLWKRLKGTGGKRIKDEIEAERKSESIKIKESSVVKAN